LGMTDVHDPQIRSYNTSRIKGENTKPEMLVRKFLFANGLHYRLNVKNLAGKPDIVLPKYKTVISIFPARRQLPCTHKFKCSEPMALNWLVVIIYVDGINSVPTI